MGTGRNGGGGGTGDNGGGQLMMAMMLLMVVVIEMMAVGRRGGEAAGHVEGQVMVLAQELEQNISILGFGTILTLIRKVPVVAL